MKRVNSIYIFLLALLAGLCACQNDVINAGASALENEDQIRVKADTFVVK